jgi:hypothetical protein
MAFKENNHSESGAAEIAHRIADLLQGVKFGGSIEITNLEAKVVQIERKETLRLDYKKWP